MRALRTPLAALCVAAATAFGVAACGEDDDSVSEGPASAVPADAPVYFESVVDLADADELNDALATLGIEDAAGMLGEQLDAELEADGETISYTEDIEPVLGERAGFFVQSFGSSGELDTSTDCVAPDDTTTETTTEGCAIPSDDVTDDGDGALVVETTDEDRARELIDQAIAESGDTAEDASHEGVDYKLNPDGGDAIAVFDGFVVGGTELGVQAAIDASAGDSLADSEEYQSELDNLGSDPVLTAYAEPRAVLDQLEASGQLDTAGRAVAEEAAGGLLDVPAVFSLGADADKITFDASTGVSDTAASIPVEESDLLRALPGDSWAATAIPDVGASIDEALQQISTTAGTAAPDFDKELRRETGLDLAALTGAIGDVAVFVRGTNVLDAGGGAVIEDLDPDATADAIGTLRRLAQREAGPGEKIVQPNVEGEGYAFTSPSVPQPVNVVQRDGKLVIAYGDEATDDAFAPTETLGDSDTFTTAADALGDYGVSLFLDTGPALDLAESSGATTDPEYAQAQPYLEHLDYLITGTSVDEDRSRARAVLGLTE
jgi:hypothetical protein